MKILVIPFFTLFIFTAVTHAEIKDTFTNFKDLASHEREGIDYRVTALPRHSNVCVLAIHGGNIEHGTEKVAREIAGSDLSLYIFEALKPGFRSELHLTSTHFDDPKAISIASASQVCASLHGFLENEHDVACVGGANTALRDAVTKELRDANLRIEVKRPCAKFGGSSSKNITNRAQQGGVQIELSTHLHQGFLSDDQRSKNFSKAVKDVLEKFPLNEKI